MKRVVLGTIFLAWLYGVPFLLVTGLVRRAWQGPAATIAESERFGAQTDLLLASGLALNAILPLVGLLAAVLLDRTWLRTFTAAVAGMLVIYAAVGVVAASARAPLIGDRPTHHEPLPRVTQCVPVSGGHGCPGG